MAAPVSPCGSWGASAPWAPQEGKAQAAFYRRLSEAWARLQRRGR